MKKSFETILNGYRRFREQYAQGDRSVMYYLSENGQHPEIMVIACCDSRVDPALILQCAPGDLFVVRNVANIVPPYEKDEAHHGTSAALEFAVCFLKVKQLVILGHSECGGIKNLLSCSHSNPTDFINNWVSIIKPDDSNHHYEADEYAKLALHKSHQNCLTFPWLAKRVADKELNIHLWYFDIKTGQISSYSKESNQYMALDFG